MCGIAGQARTDGRPVDAALVDRMCAGEEHRGPDARGVHVEAGVGLGIQRLRIIDLATGDQPIFNEAGTVAVVLNGEIYNFRELRERLIASGHTFRTESDTEVIVHLYEELGRDCVRELHGMFGLAIWDSRRRELVLARDRVGKKPLLYALGDGKISFASEFGALLQDEEIPRDLDLQALDAYFAYRYVPAPLTALRAVRKLPPACTLTFGPRGVEIDRYWSLDYGKRFEGTEQEAHAAIRDHLRRAVRKRMVADVPLGAFLSGGVDSAAVVAAMAEASPRPVETFSIGFEGELNELPLARVVAERFGTEHHELMVEPKAIEVIPKIVRHYGEPFADATAIPTFYLAEMARRHVTVALNGDGGDEAFAGYTRYVAQTALAKVGRLPAPARRLLSAVAARVPSSGKIDSTRSRIRRLGEAATLDEPGRYLAYMTDLQGFRRNDLYSDDFARAIGTTTADRFVREPWARSTADSLVDRMLDVDVAHYLPDDLLTKVDIATMACSLEGRSPLLDHELLELAASLPPELKLRGGEKKVAFRAALRGWVPDEILDAPKRGFQPPLADWFRGELRGYARDVLLDGGATNRGYFRADRVEGLLDRHASGVEDNSQGIWTLLMFELWQRDFVDGTPPTQPAALSLDG
ncbi:MAG TPA: asparagine synthase (glutamine-hydrolyzing) [Thermoleophilaceae bacterium]|nr:asparagine synthase (glutamine-hydrolyzing) [Thermoleophilaceae bacterium]